MRLIPGIIAACCCVGCVSHRAEVQAPAESIDGAAIGTATGQKVPWSRTAPQPLEVPATLWRQDDSGRLWRADLDLATPLPWWQRFPCDLVTDALWPGEAVAEVRGVPVWTAAGTDPAGLNERALAAGYARPAESP